jgi:hypothetical protein
MSERQPLTPVQCQVMDEVIRCSPHGWHPHPEALGPAEELKERGLLTRRMVSVRVRRGRLRRSVDRPAAIYTATEEFKAAARLNAALGPMVDPGSQN